MLHDDAAREYAYGPVGAYRAAARGLHAGPSRAGDARRLTVVSMKDDWKQVP